MDAFDATSEEIQRAERENHAQTKYARTLYANLQHNFPEEFMRHRRSIVIAPLAAVALGAAIETQRQHNNDVAQQADRIRTKGQRHARNIGLPSVSRNLDAEGVQALADLERAGIRALDPYAERQ